MSAEKFADPAAACLIQTSARADFVIDTSATYPQLKRRCAT
jgi:hypothetical protein